MSRRPSIGVRATPTFLFGVVDNGGGLLVRSVLEGTRPFSQFRVSLDSLLSPYAAVGTFLPLRPAVARIRTVHSSTPQADRDDGRASCCGATLPCAIRSRCDRTQTRSHAWWPCCAVPVSYLPVIPRASGADRRRRCRFASRSSGSVRTTQGRRFLAGEGTRRLALADRLRSRRRFRGDRDAYRHLCPVLGS